MLRVFFGLTAGITMIGAHIIFHTAEYDDAVFFALTAVFFAILYVGTKEE